METPSAISVENPNVTMTTSADPIDDWLDRVTRRLAVDRELQLEVRLELRSHVEESMEEFRAAGRSESDARDEALRAVGDETELSEQLWRANRRRLEAEGVWDSLLQTAGTLDTAGVGGPSHDLNTKMNRRGVYATVSRLYPSDFQVTFDLPTATISA